MLIHTARYGLAAALIVSSTCSHARQAPKLPDGAWLEKHYGFVLEVEGKRTRLYDRIADHCVPHEAQTGDALTSLLGTLVEASADRMVFAAAPNRYAFEALPHLPEACGRKPERPDDPLLNFDVLWATVAAHQGNLPDGVDWHAIREVQRPRAAAATTPSALFTVLSDTLAPLQDDHVGLTDGENEYAMALPVGGVPARDAPSRKQQRDALSAYLGGDRTPLAGPLLVLGEKRLLAAQMPGDIGYVAVLAMGGYRRGIGEEQGPEINARAAKELFAKLLRDLPARRGWIVDLRYNAGGFDSVGLALAEAFAQAPQRVYAKRAKGPEGLSQESWTTLVPAGETGFRGPVAVLIGPYTVSAGETAALALSMLPQVRVFGQPTVGAWSDAVPKRLPNGWRFTISPEVLVDAAGITHDRKGLEPDERVPTPVLGEPAARFAPAIEAARRWLQQK